MDWRLQQRCPMQEFKDAVIVPDMETPQCSGTPDCDPPESLKPYLMSVSFGSMKVCKWHADILKNDEARHRQIFRAVYGDELNGVEKAFLQLHCWGPLHPECDERIPTS
jgi:hypothetical protein